MYRRVIVGREGRKQVKNAKRLVLQARLSLLRAAVEQMQRLRQSYQLDSPTTLNLPVTAVVASRKDNYHIQHDETHGRARTQLALIPQPAQRART